MVHLVKSIEFLLREVFWTRHVELQSCHQIIYERTVAELKGGTKDAVKAMACAHLFSIFVELESDLQTKALKVLINWLCHPFVKVRFIVRDKLFLYFS